MQSSDLLPIQTINLTQENLEGWLSSYSFGKNATSALRSALKGWFDKWQEGRRVALPYVAAITCGPLRNDSFDMTCIDRPIAVPSSLSADERKRELSQLLEVGQEVDEPIEPHISPS